MLPAREEFIKPGQWHFLCRDCGARLGKRRCTTRICSPAPSSGHHREDCEGILLTELEPGYTQATSDRHPDGLWWREETRRYRMPRGKDVRQAVRQALRRRQETPSSIKFEWWPEGLGIDDLALISGGFPLVQQVEALLAIPNVTQDDLLKLVEEYTTRRHLRHAWRGTGVAPSRGEHQIVCYKCKGRTKIYVAH